MNTRSSLDDLRTEFLATSVPSMPLAGIVYWSVIAAAALHLGANHLAGLVLYGSGLIFPLGLLIDRLSSRRLQRSSSSNPLTQLFLQSLGLVVLLWPLVIFAARAAHDVNLIVLGAAILMGIIWIPYGWAANDPSGLVHAIARSLLSYGAFLLAPVPYKATAISLAVISCYVYSLLRMRRAPRSPATDETLQPGFAKALDR